jgi:hypothetical protein
MQWPDLDSYLGEGKNRTNLITAAALMQNEAR